MARGSHKRWVFGVAYVAGTIATLSCGARTELFGASGVADAGVGLDTGVVPVEASPPVDASLPVDANIAFDASVLPPIDAAHATDASICPVGTLTAYLISTDGQLYTFDPPTLTTTFVRALDCPSQNVPWTLTASSAGTVYVMYEDWNIYRVDPPSFDCTTTPYAPGQLGLGGNGGLTVAPDDAGERLYVYGQTTEGQTVLDVGSLATFVLSEVGAVVPVPAEFPLDVRADAFGRIFGLGDMGTLDQFDRTTAALVAEDHTSFSSGGSSWALLAWNDTLYFFSGGDVSQYDRVAKTLTPLGNVGITVVGASAAPCLH